MIGSQDLVSESETLNLCSDFCKYRSQFACVGLWVIDLRIVYPDIRHTFLSSPKRPNFGPLVSFISLTELTRNPHFTRHSYEKNWVMFTTGSGASYLQYELTPSERTIAQFIKGGITTRNLTDPIEEPCLFDPTPDRYVCLRRLSNPPVHQKTLSRPMGR